MDRKDVSRVRGSGARGFACPERGGAESKGGFAWVRGSVFITLAISAVTMLSAQQQPASPPQQQPQQAPPQAQQAQSGQTPTFRSGVELVTVDVGVVDRQGQPVRGLTTSDFTVMVAGQPRRVVNAEFVDSLAETSRSNLRRSSLESMISSNEASNRAA